MMLPFLLALAAPPALAGDATLATAWGTDAPAATWIFVLETALGGKKGADAAREPIAKLVEALPAGDRVGIVAAHARASEVLPPRTIDDAGRAALAAEIRALELPTAKSNDLGAAFSQVAATLDGVPEGSSTLLFYVGTFCHSPPLGSVWADGGFGCRSVRSFDKLDQAFDGGPGRDRLAVTLFSADVPEQTANPEGLALARRLFGPVATVETATEPLGAALAKLAGPRLADERILPLVRAEAGKLALTATVTRQPTAEQPTAEIELATGLAHLGLDVANVVVTGATAEGALTRLAPNGALTVAVTLPPPPFSLVPRTETLDLPVTVRLDGTLTPAGALADAGIAAARPGLTAEVTLKAERSYGLSPARSAGMFVSALLLAGGVALGVRRSVTPVRLGGSFTWRRAGGAKHGLAIEDLAEAAIVVKPDGSLGVGRREDAVLVLRVERPLWNTRATVEIRVPNAEINTRPAGQGRHPIVAGATSLQFLDYRLSWE